MGDEEIRRELLERLRAKRASIGAYVRQLQPRGARLMLLPDDALVWHVLCLVATVASLVAVVATNLYRSGDLASRLSRAEACNAQLEGLEVLVEFGRLPVPEAVKQYQQYVAAIPSIPDQPAAPSYGIAGHRHGNGRQPRVRAMMGGRSSGRGCAGAAGEGGHRANGPAAWPLRSPRPATSATATLPRSLAIVPGSTTACCSAIGGSNPSWPSAEWR